MSWSQTSTCGSKAVAFTISNSKVCDSMSSAQIWPGYECQQDENGKCPETGVREKR